MCIYSYIDGSTQPPAKHYHHDDDPPTFMSSEEAATPPDSPSDEKLSIVVEGNTEASPGQPHGTTTTSTRSIHSDSADTTEFGGRVGGADIDGVCITNEDGFSMKLRLKSNQEMERIKRKVCTNVAILSLRECVCWYACVFIFQGCNQFIQRPIVVYTIS